MNKLTWIFFIVFIVGLTTLVFPDNGPPVFRFNSLHGPSAQDLFGLTLILIAWVYTCFIIFKERRGIVEKMGRIKVSLLIIAYCISMLGIAGGLLFGYEKILWISIFIASIVNTVFIATAFNIKK